MKKGRTAKQSLPVLACSAYKFAVRAKVSRREYTNNFFVHVRSKCTCEASTCFVRARVTQGRAPRDYSLLALFLRRAVLCCAVPQARRFQEGFKKVSRRFQEKRKKHADAIETLC